MEANGTSPYYESIDLDDAYHVQTILAYDLNDKKLPVANGAPIRLRVDPRTERPVSLRMVGAAHFMRHRYSVGRSPAISPPSR